MARCPCTGTVLVDNIDESIADRSVSGSESDTNSFVHSLFGSSVSAFVRSPMSVVAVHSSGSVSAEKSTHD